MPAFLLTMQNSLPVADQALLYRVFPAGLLQGVSLIIIYDRLLNPHLMGFHGATDLLIRPFSHKTWIYRSTPEIPPDSVVGRMDTQCFLSGGYIK